MNGAKKMLSALVTAVIIVIGLTGLYWVVATTAHANTDDYEFNCVTDFEVWNPNATRADVDRFYRVCAEREDDVRRHQR